MIKRFYTGKINDLLEPNKVLVVYGPRQTGKTTLIQDFLRSYHGKTYSSTGENALLADILGYHDFTKIKSFFSGYDLIVIDEAQKIDHIGSALKIIVDQIPGIRVIATGSASFDLSNKIGEPLVGRQRQINLFPISAAETVSHFGGAYPQEHLEQFLIFGLYPEVLTAESTDKKRERLALLRDGYLYRDILEMENLRNSKKILDLLRLIAFQIGKEVSLQELGQTLGMSRATVERYLDLLEKTFVLINLRGFSRNLRSEISKTSRYYFYDVGIRNAVIDNFSPLNMRDDSGALWENFIFMERLKKRSYQKIYANMYFWRTWQQQEIDLVEERDGKIFGYEIKFSNKMMKAPTQWTKTYPQASFETINKSNYLDFII
ncbi:ATP-binding protein [Patescibacteria group bacterium]|nr:MAG: ATP-binding protein [Patescibacteria group bacterium]